MSGRRRTGTAVAAVLVFAVLHAWWLAAGAVVVAVAWWVLRLWRHPMGPCWGCRGNPRRNVGSDEAQWGRCALCKGSGERVRFGARWVHPELRRRL